MRKIRRAKLIFTFSLIASLFLAGTAGFFIGKNYSKQSAPQAIEGADFNLFWQAYSILKKNYLGNIDPQKYVFGAIKGAFESLDEPYTVFLSPDLTNEFEQELSGQLEGVGLKLGILDKVPTVIAPIENSPAAKAGIGTKDQILKVDDFICENQPIDLVVSKIRGKAGSKVKLTILPDGKDSVKEYELTREKIEVKTVEVKYIKDTAVISLNEFGSATNDDFEKIYKEASGKGVKNVVLDLRGNPGGFLDSAIQIAEYFLPKGKTVVVEESKTGKTESKVNLERGWQNVKLAVLVDEGSASASEILAGAIKDNNRGKIIGVVTFGKGVVQQLINLQNGSSVKITVSKWLTPSGLDIDKNGLKPDIEMQTPDDQNFSSNDPLVNKALEDF